MSISAYSVFTAFLWFNLFIFILGVLRKGLGVLLEYQLSPLILAIVLSLVRMLIPFEPSFSIILRSEQLLPSVLRFLRTQYVVIGTYSIPLNHFLLVMIPLVSTLLLVVYVCRLWREHNSMLKHKHTDDPRLCSIFEAVKRESPSDCPCDLYVLKTKGGPYVYNFRFSAIVLPDWIHLFSDEQIYRILQHEWQHFLNRDCMIKVVIEGLCYLLWWNPLIFLLKWDLNQMLELKCDTKVVANMTEEERDAYCQTLIDTARKCPKKRQNVFSLENVASIPFLGIPTPGQLAANSRFRQRFHFIETFSNKTKNTIGSVCIACLLLLFAISFCFTVQPFITPSENDILPNSSNYSLLKITPETSFLVDNQDGTYSLYVNQKYQHRISKQAIEQIPYISLSIFTFDNEKE